MTIRVEDPTHARYLTFGCFRRKHLFVHTGLAEQFVAHLDYWRRRSTLQLWAYVVMPNHVHLLVHTPQDSLGTALGRLKRRFGHEALR